MKLLITICNKVINFYIIEQYSMRQIRCREVVHHGTKI